MSKARDIANILSVSTEMATDAELTSAVSAHNSATDPHGDRANATTQISTHSSAADPHGDRANTVTQISTHSSAADPHGDRANAATLYATKTDFSNTAWTTFTPTLRTNGGTITLGNGSMVAAYKQLGKTVHVRYKLTIGSTTNIGANEILFGLPVTAATLDYNFAGAALDSGNAWYSLSGVGRYVGSTSEFAMISYSGTSRTFNGVGNSSMFALLDGDYITVSGSYEAA